MSKSIWALGAQFVDGILGNVQVQAFPRVQLGRLVTEINNKTVGSTNANNQSAGVIVPHQAVGVLCVVHAQQT